VYLLGSLFLGLYVVATVDSENLILFPPPAGGIVAAFFGLLVLEFSGAGVSFTHSENLPQPPFRKHFFPLSGDPY